MKKAVRWGGRAEGQRGGGSSSNAGEEGEEKTGVRRGFVGVAGRKVRERGEFVKAPGR